MNARSGQTRVAVLSETEILSAPEFCDSLAALATRRGEKPEDLEDYARKCLEELAVRPKDRWLHWTARLARFMYTRSYEPELDVNLDQLERLKAIAGKQPLVFLWSHKSHLDSFVFMRVMYDHGFRPQPLSFAGINMNFIGFGTLAKRSGAIFLRRSFANDDVYKLVFRHYIDYLVRERAPLSWSIEGTRSRTGKLMPPKLGLIQWVIEAYRREACENALLVPVSISFDQIAEMDDYVSMQRGLPKRKESLSWFFKYIKGMKTPYGRIYVRFAEPVSLAESVPVSEAMLGDQSRPDRIRVQKLAFEVCSRIEHANPITATDLLTMVLLGANDLELPETRIHAQAKDILDLVGKRKLPTVGGLRLNSIEELHVTLNALTRTGVLQRHEAPGGPLFLIATGKHLAAAYYRNTIIHYFLNAAIAELALAQSMAQDGPIDQRDVEDGALRLRDLLKFEFFFTSREQFLVELFEHLDGRFSGWRDLGNTAGAASRWHKAPPMFGHSILRSFIEVYRILSELLLTQSTDPENKSDHKQLVSDCLALGERMLTQRSIDSESALSKPLFVNALKLAGHRGLLEGDAADLHAGRARFADETRLAHDAVRYLQKAHDDSWASN